MNLGKAIYSKDNYFTVMERYIFNNAHCRIGDLIYLETFCLIWDNIVVPVNNIVVPVKSPVRGRLGG